MRIVRAAKKKRSGTTGGSEPVSRWRLVAEVLLVLAVLVAAGYVYHLFTGRLWQLTRARYGRPAHRPEVIVAANGSFGKEAWPGPEEIRRVRAEADMLVRSVSFLDPGLPQTLAEGIYEGSPWISRVHSVRRAAGGRIEILLSLRRPAAIVCRKEREYVIDRDGVRLPVAATAVAEMGLPQVFGVSTAPPVEGLPWEKEKGLVGSLRAYAAAAAALDGLPIARRFRLIGIDLGPPPAGRPSPTNLEVGNIVMLTADRTRVHWGAHAKPGKKAVMGALSVAEKQENLRGILKGLSERGKHAVCIRVDVPGGTYFPAPAGGRGATSEAPAVPGRPRR